MTRRVLLAAALAVLVALSAGCQAGFDIDVDVDRNGRGTLGLRLALDQDAQSALGISTDDDPSSVAAERFAPMLTDGGWSGGDSQIAATRDLADRARRVDTNADETPAGQNVWRARYGDCPPLQASSRGGSSSTLVNGLILAVLAGIIVIVFALRGLRRRRGRREPT